MNLLLWKYYSKYYEGLYAKLILGVLFAALQSGLVVPIALLVRYVFDTVLPSGNSTHLIIIALALFTLNLLSDGTSLWTRYIFLKITKTAVRDLRDQLVQKIYTFSRSFYNNVDQGTLYSTIVQDTERVDIMSNALIAQFLPSLAVSLSLSVVLFILNRILLLTLICLLPVVLISSRMLGREVRRRVREFNLSFEAFSNSTLRILQLLDLTHILSAVDYEVQRQQKHLEHLRLTSGSMAWLHAAYSSTQNTLIATSALIILIVGGIAVVEGKMTIGELLSFYVAAGLLNSYLKVLTFTAPQIIAGSESLKALYKLQQTNAPSPYTGRGKVAFEGMLTLNSVKFSYDERLILRDVSFAIEPHSILAIVGPNGSGKSTLVNLILGFFKPEAGFLAIDGCQYEQIDMVILRKHISVVMQDSLIFPGSIRENITYGHTDFTETDVQEALELSLTSDFLCDLPEGLATPVGDRGVLLSGGQRQRIAIARALLRKSKLLILDEPTNHLDELSTERIMHNLQSLHYSPSILLISHNPMVAQFAKELFYLDNGIMTKTHSRVLNQG